MRIIIRFSKTAEEVEAIRLGEREDGTETFRVLAPSMSAPAFSRDDVVRLKRSGGDYRFLGVVERSAWTAQWLLLPRETSRLPAAYFEFRRAVEEGGCIFEGDSALDGDPCVVISVPAGVAADRWEQPHARIIHQTSGLTPAAFLARVADQARQRATARRDREHRERRARFRRRLKAEVARFSRSGLIVGSIIALVVWWIAALRSANPQGRPRIAAIGMLVSLIPSLIGSVGDKTLRLITFVGAAVGLIALALAMSLAADSAMAAVLLGFIYALGTGGVAALFGIFSGFAASSRDLKMTWLLLVLPCALSAIAALVYAATAARSIDASLGGAGAIRFTGIVLTGLVVLGAVRQRTMRAIGGLIVPTAVIWLIVWVLGGLR